MSSAVTIWVENHFDFALVLLYHGIEHSCYIAVTATESTIVSYGIKSSKSQSNRVPNFVVRSQDRVH